MLYGESMEKDVMGKRFGGIVIQFQISRERKCSYIAGKRGEGGLSG